MDLKMEIICVGPKCLHKCFYKREEVFDTEEKVT